MKFIIASLFAAIATSSAQNDGNWKSNWSASRTLYSAFEVDPNDSRTMMRGSGDIEIGDGVAKFFGSPRMYISHDDASVVGWENVEFTAYGKYVNNTYDRSYSGLTLVTRSNHDDYKNDGCGAFGYYARVYQGKKSHII